MADFDLTVYAEAAARHLMSNGTMTRSELLMVLTNSARTRQRPHPRKTAERVRPAVERVLQETGATLRPDGTISVWKPET